VRPPPIRKRISVAISALLVIVTGGFYTPVVADDALFDIRQIANIGRSVAAELADFNGNQKVDLMVVNINGMPPEETRTISVYLQGFGGVLPTEPDHTIELPRWSTFYDLADIRESPGTELILLRPEGITIVSLANAAGQQWDLPVQGSGTIGVSSDERGFDRIRLVSFELADEALLLVPQFGTLSILTATGSTVAQLDVARRGNYLVVPRSGPIAVESDIQLFYDSPKITVGDVDGDGRADIVASTRHEYRVFLQNEHASFPREADTVQTLGYVTERDHQRGSGGVVTTPRDIDGDGRLDLMISHVQGSFTDATTTTYIFRNREGAWNLDEPDDTFVDEGTLGSDLLVDIDQDKRLELVRLQLKFSLFELIKLFISREVDSQLEIHRLNFDGHYSARPWVKRKISTGISFDTFRSEGFIPPVGIDINADGYADMLSSANGKGIEVYLGGGKKPFAKRAAIQKFPTVGVIHFTDFNNDKLPDFMLFDPQDFNVPIQLGVNRGILPVYTPPGTAED
jgi:hypothetical protein